jgi:uncharacterized protein (TIGR04255 family)
MGRRYRNPPVIEALCEFRFESGEPWDMAVPGLVYEKVRDGFPKRRQVQGFETTFASGPKGIQQQIAPTSLIQFLRDDEKAVIQVGPNLLAVNHLKPYPGWQDFLPLIRRGFEAYCGAASPKGIDRVGLRYINLIEFPGERVELEDYLEFRPFVGPRLPQDHGAFIVGIQVSFENARDALRLQLASSAVETPNVLAVVLDLDYFLVQQGAVPKEQVFDWIEIAHHHLEEVFEACITNRLRQLFDEVTEG